MGGEDAALGAGEVVLGELGDLLEEMGAVFVVEEPGGEGFGGGGEADAGFVGYGFDGANGGDAGGLWSDGDGRQWSSSGCVFILRRRTLEGAGFTVSG